ncbi:hypothetical protein ACQEVZ_11950 [Dactylosporangium sp. CA-152071]
MDIRVIRSGTVHTHAVEELPALAAISRRQESLVEDMTTRGGRT